MDLFEAGKKASLEAFLAGREWRQSIQKTLIQKYPKDVLVSVKLNIPGSVKNSPLMTQLFRENWSYLKSHALLELSFAERVTGPEGFLVFSGELAEIKRQMIDFEEISEVGRLFDLDVVRADGTQISRTELGFGKRKCYVCDRIAKECAREQRHSAEEIKGAINELVRSFFARH